MITFTHGLGSKSVLRHPSEPGPEGRYEEVETMLKHEMLTEKGILLARPNGPLTEEDFSALSADADAYIEAHGELNGLVICAEAFPGWEGLDGFVSHFKFVRDHHRKISKVAFVSDSNVLALLPRIANHFVSAEVRHFMGDNEVEALEWIGL